MPAEIRCCGVWTGYPQPGRDTRCPVCGSVFTVADRATIQVLAARLDKITITAAVAAEIWTGPDDGDTLRARLAEVAGMADEAGELTTALLAPGMSLAGDTITTRH